MHDLTAVLQLLEGVGFVLLGAGNVVAFRRAADRRHLHLALALGPLGLITLLGRLDEATRFRLPGIADATVLLFLASAYGLLEFRHDFLRYSARIRRALHSTLAGTAVLALAVRFPRGDQPVLSPIETVAALMVVMFWALSTLEPSIRFWVAARRLPTVQRDRMRVLALAVGSLGGLLLLMMVLGPLARRPWFTPILHTVVIASLPALYSSFAPPAWLRRAWRRREEDALVIAAHDLTRYYTDREDLAARALSGAVRLLGAEAGFVADPSGRVLASNGIELGSLDFLAGHLRSDGSPATTRLGEGRHAVTAPLRLADGIGTLAVVSGAFTPLFGSDEVARLQQLAWTSETALERVRLSNEVEDEKARYESLMHAISDVGEGVVVAEGTRLVYANQAYMGITGYSFEELAAMESLLDLAPEDERPRLIEQYRRRRAGEAVPDHYETAFIHRDGRRVEVEVALKLVIRDGRLQAISIIRDITERKWAENAQRRNQEQLAQAQALAGLGSWEWDVTTDTLRWSAELFRIFGVEPDAFVPSFEAYMERIHPEDRDATQRAIGESLAETRTFAFDHRAMLPDGTERILHCQGDVETNGYGEPMRMFGTALDVTERAHTEDALRRAYEHERGAAERLRSVDAMKNAFLTAVSHELRTPLTAVLGFAKTLEEHGDSIAPPERRAFLSRLSANAEKLDRLLNDLLDVDRLSRGMIEPVRRPVDLGQLALRVASESTLVQGRRVHLDTPEVTISADAAKVERIIENLIANAVRHTPDGTPIWIRTERAPGGALIVVEDEGPGVPAELREAVFEPFRQGPDAPAHSPGVGIGLSLVFGFAELHGGRAWIEDRPGGGASFHVFLPDPAGAMAQGDPEPVAAGAD